MNEENNKNTTESKTTLSMQDKVLQAISDGQVKMKPKWHFVVRTALLVVGTILVSLSLVYIASFIVFILRQNGSLFISGYGWHGLNVLLNSIPWLLILLTTVFIILLQILIKKYSFGYGKPLMYYALAIIGIVIVGGLLLEQTRIHQGLFQEAENNRLPLFGSIYRQFGEEHSDSITIGKIRELLSNGFLIDNHSNNNIIVVVTPETKLPPNSSLKAGDIIFVFGHQKGSIVEAEGIREFDGVMPPTMQMMMDHDDN